jgi:hypothetical protein
MEGVLSASEKNLEWVEARAGPRPPGSTAAAPSTKRLRPCVRQAVGHEGLQFIGHVMRERVTHSDPRITMNVSARARDERLSEITEKVAEKVLSGIEHVPSMHKGGDNVTIRNAKPNSYKSLAIQNTTGDGGNRTPSSAMRPRRVPVTPRPQFNLA